MGGTTYDAKGDVLTDSLHNYAWDVETRPTTIDSISVTYDALGRIVEEGDAGTYTQSVYAGGWPRLDLIRRVPHRSVF